LRFSVGENILFRTLTYSRFQASFFAAAAIFSASLMVNVASGAIIQFDLQGKAGTGLLGGNENLTGGISPTNPGSGGEIGTGIFYDDVSKVLNLNVGWGAGNGFTNLSNVATATHLHGPTALPATPADFAINNGVVFGLDAPSGQSAGIWTPSASNGSFIGTVSNFTAVQESILLAGHYYFNVHTAANGGGEIRGNLVAVPEPGSFALMGLVSVGMAGMVWKRRNRSKQIPR